MTENSRETKTERPTEKEFYSTTEAAQRLGLSLGTVQQMVESGALEAWKTLGGHRRIRVSSVESFLSRAGGTVPLDVPRLGGVLQVLIAEDDPMLQKLYAHTLQSWKLPLEVQVVSNGVDALFEIGRAMPDLLITDLLMPAVDGFEMIRRLRSNPQLPDMDIVVITGIAPEDIDSHGGLPADIVLYTKPAPFRELRGYVQAKVAQVQRRNSRSSTSSGS
jgi:excisionase family DNA binding protein